MEVAGDGVYDDIGVVGALLLSPECMGENGRDESPVVHEPAITQQSTTLNDSDQLYTYGEDHYCRLGGEGRAEWLN